MPKKSDNINHTVIHINTEHKKKKRRRKKRSHRPMPLIQYGYNPISPYTNLQQQLPMITNKPYYIETNTINPQLMYKDEPKAVANEDFLPKQDTTIFTNHEHELHLPAPQLSHQSNDTISEMTERSHTRGKLYDLANKYRRINNLTEGLHASQHQAEFERNLRRFGGLKTKMIRRETIKNRNNYEHENKLYADRLKDREKKGTNVIKK